MDLVIVCEAVSVDGGYGNSVNVSFECIDEEKFLEDNQKEILNLIGKEECKKHFNEATLDKAFNLQLED